MIVLVLRAPGLRSRRKGRKREGVSAGGLKAEDFDRVNVNDQDSSEPANFVEHACVIARGLVLLDGCVDVVDRDDVRQQVLEEGRRVARETPELSALFLGVVVDAAQEVGADETVLGDVRDQRTGV